MLLLLFLAQQTLHVTNLNDSGPGSLRDTIQSVAAPSNIVFDTAGTIELKSTLVIGKPNLTIDGSTAPAPGITITGWNVIVDKTHHVTIRQLHIRPGDQNCPANQNDAFTVSRSTDVLIDHISASWSIDEVLSVVHSDRVTVQWSIIAESLNKSCHAKGAHGYGSLIRYGDGTVTFHHNLFAHNRSRNPRVGDNIQLNFLNNVIYNYGYSGGQATYTGPAEEGITKINYLGNCTLPGPSTDPKRRDRTLEGGSTNTHIHQDGNYLDGRPAGAKAFVGEYTFEERPFPLQGLFVEPAEKACFAVLGQAGANIHRDPIDSRIVNDVKNRTGAVVDKPSSKLSQ
jgi:pectate lyase